MEQSAKISKWRSVPHDSLDEVTFEQGKRMNKIQVQWNCKSVMDHLPGSDREFDSSQTELVLLSTIVDSLVQQHRKNKNSNDFCSMANDKIAKANHVNFM